MSDLAEQTLELRLEHFGLYSVKEHCISAEQRLLEKYQLCLLVCMTYY